MTITRLTPRNHRAEGLNGPVRGRTRVVVVLVAAMMLTLVGAISLPSPASAAATSFALDFGSGPTAAGFTGVPCSTTYNSALGYGFTSTAGIDTKNRNTADPLLTDFCFGNVMDVGVDVPSGNYSIRLIAGDATASQGKLTVTSENETVIAGVGAPTGTYVDRTFITHVTDGQLSLHLTSTPARINALIITPFVWEPGLSLTDDGSGSVVLKNSNVSLRLTKKTAEITALYRNGDDPTLNYLRGGGGAYLANWSIDGVAKSQTIKSASYQVVQQDSERVEVVLTQNDPAVLPFVLEIHIALDKSSQGLYYYTVYRYTDTMPSGLAIQQLRYAFRTDGTLFTSYAIDDQRQGVAPRESDFAPEEVQDATYRLPDGSVYSKYQQISDDEGSNSVFGVYGDGVGLSLIQPNKDWMAGGPTRQELTTHTVESGQILNWHENSRHYGATDVVPERGWEKVYGPFFLYVQAGDSQASMWADAKSTLADEVGKWPYRWISNPLYAAGTRADVTGTLEPTGGASPSNAWVVLADPGVDVQSGNGSYVYSARANAEGTFRIPAVRPGSYTLHAFVDGISGELTKPGITVNPSTTVDLGDVQWKTSPPGQTLWRIGVPDRAAGEFAVPEGEASPVAGLEPWRQYGTWLNYPLQFPEDVNFHIGVDNPATDWPYFQPMMKTPGNPDELKVAYDPTPTRRDITFELAGTPNSDADLTLGIASAVFASLAIEVNGTRVAAWDALPGPSGDNALYRHSDRGQYRELKVQIPANLLHKGTNVIALTPAVAPNAEGWTSVYANVMYDFVQFDWSSKHAS